MRDSYLDRFRTVVAGIDLSATSRRALQVASLIAHGDGARLYAVHVVPDSLNTYARFGAAVGPDLDAFVNEVTCEHPRLEVHTNVLPYCGYRSGVVDSAALVNAGLVAVGTRGRSNLRDLVLGSTAEKILRDSVCAVLAVNPR